MGISWSLSGHCTWAILRSWRSCSLCLWHGMIRTSLLRRRRRRRRVLREAWFRGTEALWYRHGSISRQRQDQSHQSFHELLRHTESTKMSTVASYPADLFTSFRYIVQIIASFENIHSLTTRSTPSFLLSREHSQRDRFQGLPSFQLSVPCPHHDSNPGYISWSPSKAENTLQYLREVSITVVFKLVHSSRSEFVGLRGLTFQCRGNM